MAKLSSTIPEYGFPGEFDTIRFQEVGGPMTFRVACDDAAIDLLLSPDENQCVVVEDFAPVLRDFTADGMPRVCTLSWDGGTQSFTVLPCRHDIAVTAEDFGTVHFLTLQQGKKPTYIGAQEFVTLYSALPSRDAFSLSLLWTNWQTGEVRETSLSEEQTEGAVITGTYFHRLDVSPAQFTPPAEGFALNSYTVAAGKRSLRFIVFPVLDAKPLTFVFRNCFGQFESFHCFGTMQQEVKPTRSTASFAGKTRNYSVQSAPEFTANTGILRPCDFNRFEDFCTADYVLMGDENGPEVCITDNDFKLSSDLYVPQSASITWRYARRSRRFEVKTYVRTFDDTFDETYL